MNESKKLKRQGAKTESFSFIKFLKKGTDKNNL